MCGLTFFTGKGEPDIQKLTILGIYNDSRGGDSCGISYNNKVWKGTNKDNKLFQDFITTFKERDLTGVNTLLIHTRKATSGHSAANAHPFSFRTSSKGKVVVNDTKYKPDFIGMHNGTVKNHLKLKSDFDLGNWADMDSKVMLGALYTQDNYDILKAYDGAAVLVWYRGDDLYVFKGGSWDGKWEDRSLFYVQEPEGLYFSSLKNSLEAISTNKVVQLPINKVYHYKKGELISTTPIEKEKPALPPIRKLISKAATVYTDDYDFSTLTPETVYQRNLRYYQNGSKLHGNYHINIHSSRVTTASYNNNSIEEFFFLDGIMIKSRIAYNKWKGLFESIIEGKDDRKLIDFVEFSESFAVPSSITSEDDQIFFYEEVEDLSNILFLDGNNFTDSVLFPITSKYVESVNGIIITEENGIEEFRDDINDQIAALKNSLKLPGHIIQEMDEKEIDFVTSLNDALNGVKIL